MSAFCRLVREVLDELPDEFHRRLDNVIVDVELEPSAELRKSLDLESDDELFGLFDGVSIVEQEHDAPLPNRILIFKGPLEAACRSRDELAYEIRRTVLHELAHQFGYSEEDLDPFESQPSPFDKDDDADGEE
jgi:predicted Zn-dependent protease with MMP-like domain